jgi:cobaltochelatase CobN
MPVKTTILIAVLMLLIAPAHANPPEKFADIKILFIHPCSLPVKEAGQNISWQNTTLLLDVEEPDTLIAGNRNLDYDIIFVHMLNYQPELYSMIDKAINETDVSVIFTSSTSEWDSLMDKSNVDKSIRDSSSIYIDNGGEENMKRLLTYLAVMLKGANETIIPPILIPDNAIFHPGHMGDYPCPDCVFQNVTSYLDWYRSEGNYTSNAPTIGIALYKSYYANNNINDTIALIREFERRGANLIPVFYKDNFSEFFQHESFKPDVIVYQRAFRVNHSNPDAGIQLMKDLNVPWIQAITLSYQTQEEWMNSTQGISPAQIPWTVAMPELDGIAEPFVIGTVVIDNATGAKQRIGMPDRIERFVNRTLMLANLRYLNNSEKRVALIYYNYPPGKDSIGASYLDVPMTLEVLLNSFYDRGYDLGNFTKFNLSEKKNLSSNESIVKKLLAQGRNIGVWKQDEIDALASSGAVALVHNDTYIAWFNELPEELKDEVIKEWGTPPGNQMVFENTSGKYIVIPNIRYGNMLLAPQPYRGFLNDASKTYHDTELPPNHQYIAFYFWLKKVYNASVLVHVGTHGTLEWLPGKQLGLSGKCWSDILIQDFPNSYIYIVDNVGEGTQAKRRSYSVIIDHLTPAFLPSGLYGNLSALHEVLHNYKQAKQNNQSLLIEAYKNESLLLMLDLNLGKDLNISISTNMSTAEFESIIEKTHDYLHELQFMNMPYGLRIFGINPNNESMITLVAAMLGDGFLKNIENINSSCPVKDNRGYNQTCSFRLLYEVLINKKDKTVAQDEIIGANSTNVTNDLIRAEDYANRVRQSSTDEINNLLNSLEGKYIPPAPGGDPIRNPSALPTGRNFYSFDPRTIPTKASYQVGKQTMDALLDDYYNRTGRYPEKVAFTVWATETMRNQGVVQSQILYLLGIEPKYDKSGRVIYYMSRNPDDLSLMNESELGRPRIDVIIISSGLHRDQFPLQMELMDAAVRKAISAENITYDNYPRKHYQEIKTLLINATCGNFSEEEIDKLAMARIFSEAPGSYGPRIGNPIEASYTWNDTEPIAELYLKALGNIYINGSFDTANPCIFASYLKDTEIAIHSRSSNLFGVLDNDDVFQYLGGLSLAIAHVSEGKRPEMWITNLRNPQEAKMQTLLEFMLAEERTRLFNPLWIKGLMEHGYAGPRTLAKHIENLWGWQVVDPRFVDAYSWQQVYDIYVQDKYSLGLKDYFAENNPWAYQSITARMLEAIRKGYWDPDEDIKKSLAKEFEESVKKYNVACCHHTCSNPLLREYIDGMISMPQVTSYQSSSGSSTISETTTNQSNEEKTITKGAGAGFESDASGEKESGEEVSGQVFQKKEQVASSLSTGSAPLIGMLFVIMILGFIALGYLRRR